MMGMGGREEKEKEGDVYRSSLPAIPYAFSPPRAHWSLSSSRCLLGALTYLGEVGESRRSS